jgi:Tol biopolymer transport system component
MTLHRHLSPTLIALSLTLVATAGGAAGGAGAGNASTEQSAASAATGSASVSPAARRNESVVFQRIDPLTGKTRLYTVRPDGSRLRAVTRPGAGEERDSLADWSPDGRSIALTRFFGGRHCVSVARFCRSDVLVVRPGGTGVRNLTRAGCSGDCVSSEYPSWSPDGRRIAFERALGPLPSVGPPPIVGIFVMNADGSNVRQLTQLKPNSGSEDHGPSWSPDGRRIAFMRSNNTIAPVDASAIYSVNADGSDLRLVRRMPRERPGAGTPNWSPDGRRLLFSTYSRFGSSGQAPTGAQLFTVKPNGRGLRQLTHLPGNSYNPAWSPDGSKIVFARNRTVGPEADLFTMNADGTQVRRLTHSPELRAGWPDWRPPLGRQPAPRARDRAQPTTSPHGGALAPVAGTTPPE